VTILRYPPFVTNTGVGAAFHNVPPLRWGSRGKSVQALQLALSDLGYDLHGSYSKAGEPDGVFGSEMEEAVRTFQADRQLPVDGAAGRETIGELDRLMVAIHGPNPPAPAPEYAGPAPAPGGAPGGPRGSARSA
jgi:peptidoglycan hydrolase-like protein with peptidoglycan-binding domain